MLSVGTSERYSSISRSAGGTVDFTLPGGTQSLANGLTIAFPLGYIYQQPFPYITVNGTDWAEFYYYNQVIPGMLPYTGYTTGDLGTLTVGGNVSPTGPQSVITSAKSVWSLKLTGSEGVTMSGSGSVAFPRGGGLMVIPRES